MKKRLLTAVLACLFALNTFNIVFADEQVSDTQEAKSISVEADDGAVSDVANPQPSDESEDAETDNYTPDIGTNKYLLSSQNYLYKTFDELMKLYVNEHINDFTREELLEKFVLDLIEKHPEFYKMYVNTLLNTMDKYSSLHESKGYLTPTSSTGFGIEIQELEQGITIKGVMKGSVAESLGILPGDIIKSVMGIDVTGLPWAPVSAMLKYPNAFIGIKDENGKYINQNPEVPVIFERDGKLLEFILTKGEMVPDGLDYQYYEKEGVAYISISSFQGDTLVEDFKKLVLDTYNNGTKKLIIDLCNNGGGIFTYALDMSEIFVENGEPLCYMRTKKNPDPSPIIAENETVHFDSISVMVNENTASAAELMASILKNEAGAVIVGKTSYGKAVGQTVFGFFTGDVVSISTYEILDSNMESYNEIGLIPDLEIDNTECLYELPEMKHFNHTNYKEIVPGVYSEPCLALEQRLNVMDYLDEKDVDGIWDNKTNNAVYILQRASLGDGDGTLNDATVTAITDIINTFKDYTYYDESIFDVALIYHSSFSQAKRLIAEKQRFAKEEKEKLDKHNKLLETVDSYDDL